MVYRCLRIGIQVLQHDVQMKIEDAGFPVHNSQSDVRLQAKTELLG